MLLKFYHPIRTFNFARTQDQTRVGHVYSRDNITKNVHSIIYRPFGLYGRYEGLKTYKQVLNRISVQEITIPNIKM